MIRRNKYNAQGCRYNGRWYHSRAERGYAELLDLFIKTGSVKSWRPQVSVNLPGGIKWKVDFEVTDSCGNTYMVEVKGMATPEYKLKLELYRAKQDEMLPLFVVRKYGEGKYRIIDEVGTYGLSLPEGGV